MGFIITTNIPLITPAYSPMLVTLNASSADYMDIEIQIRDTSTTVTSPFVGTYDTRVIRILGNTGVVDIQSVIHPFFESDASSVISLKEFHLRGITYISGVEDTSILDKSYYVFNGVNKDFSYFNYIFDGSVNAKFLNNWNTYINIHPNDKTVPLFFFHGYFNSSTSVLDVSTVSFDIYKNGAFTKGYKTAQNNLPSIYRLNVDPSSLNNLVQDLSINGSTTSYSIDPSKNTSTIYMQTINIKPIVYRYTPVRVQWVNSLGVANTFNFDMAKTNAIEIEKQTYNNFGTLKVFNTKVKDIYSGLTDWITEEESIMLKDLWHSPSIMIDGKYAILRKKSENILTRNPGNMINYSIEYEFIDEYISQKN